MWILFQPHKCMILSPSNLLFDFSPPTNFCCHWTISRFLGVLFTTDSFTSSFVQDTLDQDVHHVNVLSRLKDVQVVFGFFFGVSPKNLLICSIPWSYQSFGTSLPFLHNLHVSFWETFLDNNSCHVVVVVTMTTSPRFLGPRFFGLLSCPFSMPTSFFPHFS